MFDTGRVTLVMRARKAGGGRFPFLRTERRRYVALALTAGLAVAGLGALLIAALR